MRPYRLSYYFFLILFLLVFNSCGTESTPIYNLTTSVDGEGTITPSDGEFEEGETVTLTSEPNEGWMFQEWSGDGSGSSNSLTITMDSDKEIVGNFHRRDYPLTLTTEGEGTVIEEIVSSPKTTDYTYETVVELTSQPDDGWVFYQWSGDLEGRDNPQTIEIEDEKEVTSEFRIIDDLLNIEKSGEGTVDITQESFENNPSRNTITLTPNPSDGYKFVEWSDWDGEVNEDNEIEITLDEEKNVSVKFSPIVFLGENGVTVMCPDGEVGDIGIVGGVEYEVVDRDLLIQRYEEGKGKFEQNVCVSLITDMSGIFKSFSDQLTPFNQPIGNWDVSNVTDMSTMFFYSEFNQPIDNWDVGKVTNMSHMFGGSNFNQPIGDWNVSNVKNMTEMFSNSQFNQSIGNWDVRNVTNMGIMFSYSQFNQPIGNWDVSNVTDMRNMFGGSPFNQPIGDWDVSNVTNMSTMFDRSQFNQPIGNWNVSNVTGMDRMFSRSQFNQSIGDWNVSNVTNMGVMFYESPFNQDISSWCVWRIGNEPERFSTNSPLTEENKPVWGTCPD